MSDVATIPVRLPRELIERLDALGPRLGGIPRASAARLVLIAGLERFEPQPMAEVVRMDARQEEPPDAA